MTCKTIRSGAACAGLPLDAANDHLRRIEMKLSAILFDLDGTLLPMDNDLFTKVYFSHLAKAAAAWGYTDSEFLIKAVWKGVAAMVQNDYRRSNADAFWQAFQALTQRDVSQDLARFSRFYDTDFNKAREAAAPTPLAKEALLLARKKARHVILATNPIFPRNADETRLSWLGLSCDDFDLVTDYENCGYCKPNPDYYRDILARFGLEPEKCLMIGNDVDEDVLPAQELGIKAFLLDDYVINRHGRLYDCPRGSYAQMIQYLQNLDETPSPDR